MSKRYRIHRLILKTMAVRLPDDIRVATSMEAAVKNRKVVLTGGTGFILGYVVDKDDADERST